MPSHLNRMRTASSPQPQKEPAAETPKVSVLERLLAYSAIIIIVIAVVAFLTTLVVAMVAGRTALENSLWPLVTWLAFYGLPIGFVLLVTLLIINFSRRGNRK